MSDLSPVAQIEEWLVSGHYHEAREACLDALAEHPADPDFRALLALCDDGIGDRAGAVAQLRAILQAAPEHVRTLFHFARLSLESGDADAAREALESCIALAPNHAPSRHLLARLDQQAGDSAKAIEGLRVALRADSDYIPALCDLAILLVERGEVDEAHRHASQAIRQQPDEAGVQLAMGIVFEAQNHLSFAEQCLVNATDQDPNGFQGLMALTRVYQKQNRHAEAIATLERLSDDQKTQLAARYARAFSLMRLGQWQPAKALYEGIVEQRPDNSTILQLLDLYIQINDVEGLMALPKRVDAQDGEADWAKRFVEARLAEFSGQLDHSIDILQGLVHTPVTDHSIRARLLLARLQLKKGDASACLQALESLATENLLHHRVRWEMAQLAEQAGDLTFALRMLDAVLANESLPTEVLGRSATMRLHLLDRLGDYEKAKALMANQTVTLGWLPVPEPMMHTDVPKFDWSGWTPPPSASDPDLIWVPGWPWAGRELVLAALAQMDGAQVLPLAEGLTRHQHLGMVPGQVYHMALNPEQVAPMRKRYLRGAHDDARVLIEPFPCKAADLIRMHQAFPQAKAVRVLCDPNYLRLQWHFAGYQAVDEMLVAWQREQEALDALITQGQIPMVSVALSSLLDPSTIEGAIETLMKALSYPPQDKMAKHVQALIQRHSYRLAAHWTHYF